jgi:hypothetical protein
MQQVFEAQQERQGGARESTGGARERTVGSARTVPYCSFEEIAWIAANGPQIKMPTFEALAGHSFWEENDDYTSPEWYFTKADNIRFAGGLL